MLVECQCCFEELENEPVVECTGPRPHVFCMTCAKKQLELDVTRGRSTTGCLMDRACPGLLSSRTRDLVLSEGSRRAAERLESLDQIHRAGLEGYWQCPFCDFGALCEEVEGETTFWCRNPSCQRESCRSCQGEAHHGRPCASGAEERLPSGVCRCPACGRMLEREAEDGPGSGCNQLRCVCGRATVCVVCGVDTTLAGYGHFNNVAIGVPVPAGSCRLYGGPDRGREW